MDLQKAKGTRRNAHSKNEEETDYLPGYREAGDSKKLPKNDSLEQSQTSPSKETPSDDVNGNTANSNRPLPHNDGSSFTSPTTPPPNTPNGTLLNSLWHEEKMLVPEKMGLDLNRTKILRRAEAFPPVTKSTLSELDLSHIMNNIRLRMDANFDGDLHFRPDLDGEKGQKKRSQAAEYWAALATEISIYTFCASSDENGCDKDDISNLRFEPRLPIMFETLQDILKTLVPERDHSNVMQNLDVPLLMQQIHKGVLDLINLSKWLAGLLKTHCAPMRDEWADQMVSEISAGLYAQDMEKVVGGLRTLFGMLEAMKLDVANHQIRAFRVLLIEDTIPFLQNYFLKKIATNKFNAEPSRTWYIDQQEKRRAKGDETSQQLESGKDKFNPVATLFHGLFDLLLSFDHPTSFPETFHFDTERLLQLRVDLQDLINLEICYYILDSLLSRQGRHHPLQPQIYANLQSRILTLLENSDNGYGSHKEPCWQSNIGSIALEIGRAACIVCGCPSIPDEVIIVIEKTLDSCFSRDSELFQYYQKSIRDRLEVATFTLAKKYMHMSPLAICESQRARPGFTTGQGQMPPPPPPQHQQQTLQQLRYSDHEGIARRLAHIGVLHWRVWAPLLYTREETATPDARRATGESDVADCS
ncbi:hypothetical protein FQN54_009575 [Arachnomyces sp. PD_36]|nr:hypothetical protein FQN54_009575 [Arachnomyces sp. PD_36]